MSPASPLGFEHVNMLGRYAFPSPETVACTTPHAASDEPDEPALT